MSRTIDRHRMRHNQDLLFGEDDAAKYSGIIADLARAGGEIASSQIAKKKADAAKKAMEDADKNEKDPNGPLHVAARKLAGTDTSTKPGAGGPSSGPQKGGVTSKMWFWPAVIGGVGVVGLVGYKLMSGGHRRRGR
jgi:hypothetical protein